MKKVTKIVSPKKYYYETIFVYFDQKTGAPHAVPWSKSFVSCIFPSLMEKRKKKRKESTKIKQKKHALKGGLPVYRCYSENVDGRHQKVG